MRKRYLATVGALLLGLFLGYFFFAPEQEQEGESEVAEDQVYTCSMHPEVRQNEPGDCPKCGMELIPADDLEEEGETVLQMSENAIQIGDVRSSEVERLEAEKRLRLQGEVEVDERRISSITARFPGRIERLHVDFTGQEVQKGQKLASIYSPELIAAQQELFEAKKQKERDPAFYQAAKSKLELWDLGEEEIRAIEDSGKPMKRVDIRAPHSGVVMERKVSTGEYLKEGAPLFRVADLSRIWVIFHAYEGDLPWLEVGDEVAFDVPGIPGENFKASVRFIHPTMEKGSRTVSIRAEAPNPNGELRPGMFANGRIDAELDFDEPQLVVPSSAILWTGERSIAYVEVPDTKEPTYQLRELELGTDLGHARVVEEGLEEGERVVTHGAFRVDAAAQLAGKKSMMQEMGGGAPGHDHGGMQMEEEGQSSGRSKARGDHGEGQGVLEDPPEGFSNLIGAYLDVKNALVGSEPHETQVAANKGLKKLDELEEGLSGKEKEAWDAYVEELRSALERIKADHEEIEKQREHFEKLSSVILDIVGKWGTGDRDALYRTHCPMAMDGEGADWMSEFEEVKNPYYGEEMLDCGSVKEVYKE